MHFFLKVPLDGAAFRLLGLRSCARKRAEDTDMQKRSFEYLTGLESDSKKGLALQAVQKNPRLLTVPVFEYERTKPSLEPLRNGAVRDRIGPEG